MVVWLAVFYGISKFVGYLMPNPIYTYVKYLIYVFTNNSMYHQAFVRMHLMAMKEYSTFTKDWLGPQYGIFWVILRTIVGANTAAVYSTPISQLGKYNFTGYQQISMLKKRLFFMLNV